MNYLHIAFNWRTGVKVKELEPTFNRAIDWARYAPNCWVIKTRKSSKLWYGRLEKYLEPGDTVLICKLDVTEKWGKLPKWAWDWLNEPLP